MKKIVMLDAYPFQEHDFAFLARFGQVVCYENTAPEQLHERIIDADIILTNKTKLSDADFSIAKKLRYVSVIATGYNVVDVVAATTRGITVTNIPAYSTDSVAQHTFALLLELTNHVGALSRDVKQDVWASSQRFCLVDRVISELSGKTLGIIGFGVIGQRVACIAKAFGMQVKVATRTVRDNSMVVFCSREDVVKTSDIITLHCPVTPDTYQMINAKSLTMMKPSALLLNTSRGDLVDESALHDALKAGRIAGAALDVLAKEPPVHHHPLSQLANCIITPHVAWSSAAARARVLQVTEENVAAFVAGKPNNVVNHRH